MLIDPVQSAWIRACRGKYDNRTIDHPFTGLLHAPRVMADIQAMASFRESAFHDTDADGYLGKLGRMRNALLQARAEILGSRKYPGVHRNMESALADLSLSALRPEQSAYIQLWYKAYPDALPRVQFIEPAVNNDLLKDLVSSLRDEARFLRYLEQIPVGDVTSDPETAAQAKAERNAEQPALLSEEDVSDAELLQDSADENQAGVMRLDRGSSKWPGYKIFDRRFDQVLPAAQLAEQYNYSILRNRLLQDIPDYELLTRRLVNRLRRVLLALQRRSWMYDQEEGWLNPGRLASWVAAPASVQPFRQEMDNPFPDTAVTLLMDCSGSMRGQSILMAAACIDVLTQAMEQCGIKVEVLGYTTGAWDEGPVTDAWKSNGMPECAGRLNQLQHVIFKEYSQPWRRARQSLGAVLNEQWLRENIDGESVWWAYQRLNNRYEVRKILLVISDGLPRDHMTDAHNTEDYLAQHLRQVIAEIEANQAIDLYAIGVGHAVERFYRQAVSISHMQGLAQVLTEKLTSIFQQGAISSNQYPARR